MIVAQYPSIKGINFDLHHVVEATPNYPGVEHVGGDMFIEIPRADTIFMKYILHDWSDDLCLKILGNCYKALPKKGKVIVVDSILPTQVEHELPARMRYQMDLLMFSYTEGGKEHTKEELERLAKGEKKRSSESQARKVIEDRAGACIKKEIKARLREIFPPLCSLGKGVEHVGGDMFIEIPRANTIFMKLSISCTIGLITLRFQDFYNKFHCSNRTNEVAVIRFPTRREENGDELCLKILENCYKALPKKGKVIVVDSILPTQVEHELPVRMRYQMDLLMFSYTEGGKQHKKEELERVAKASGFDRMQFICNLHGLSVVEFHKDTI
ncbi:hypothetical protein GOP47_0006241 [Adiantum capillus-veneris]|uniref:O-methyltransferase C-terminal domain-containing protein n=1 Tax=Adiantum capillus-veneris TaxID=13818 RepID=A0A9D4V2H1_ADICA|nr:hypothetical protein GOP47_0006241 [Adiantum capillus-veneris]